MKRAAAWLVAGAVIGASVLVSFSTLNMPAATTTSGTDAMAPLEAVPGANERTGRDAGRTAPVVPLELGGVAERARLYASAAASTDVAAMVRRISEVAAGSLSRSRDLELEALLLRLVELDPERAVGAAEQAYLEPRFFGALFGAWATRDARAALAALGKLQPPAARRAASAASLDALGYGERSIARVAAALPAGDLHAFRIEALERLAERDPRAALQLAQSLDEFGTQLAAVSSIAGRWVREDASAALGALDGLRDEALARSFLSGALEEWARVDVDASLGYLTQRALSGLPPEAARAAIRAMAETDPERLLASVDALDVSRRQSAQRLGFTELAERDIASAVARIDAMPRTRENESLRSLVAGEYARRDPDAAFAWAAELDPPSISVASAVISEISAADPDRALDLLADMLSSGSAMTLSGIAFDVASGDRAPQLLNRLLASDGPTAGLAVRRLLSYWMGEDRQATAAWVLGNLDRLGDQAFSFGAERERNALLAQGIADIARTDAVRARALIDRYFTDDVLRRDAEEMLNRAAAGGL